MGLSFLSGLDRRPASPPAALAQEPLSEARTSNLFSGIDPRPQSCKGVWFKTLVLEESFSFLALALGICSVCGSRRLACQFFKATALAQTLEVESASRSSDVCKSKIPLCLTPPSGSQKPG